MADQSDVEKALVSLIDSILYPTGQNGNPPLTVVGAPCRIERGWPDQTKLDADLRASIFNVSVYPKPNMERVTTRYPERREENPIPAVTYGLAAAGQVITVSGGAPTPYVAQNLAAWINGAYYVYQATTGQTPAQAATGLAAAIGAGIGGVVVAGPAITIPTGLRIGDLVVGTTGSVQREVRRQEKHFQIILWCHNPDLRDAVAKAIDEGMSQVRFLSLSDGSGGRLTYSGNASFDAPQKELLYRRDLIYCVEYGTIITEAAAQIVVSVADAFGPFGQPITGLGGLDFSDPTNSGLLPLV